MLFVADFVFLSFSEEEEEEEKKSVEEGERKNQRWQLSAISYVEVEGVFLGTLLTVVKQINRSSDAIAIDNPIDSSLPRHCNEKP